MSGRHMLHGSALEGAPHDATEIRMDRMYRHQRYIYDLTRKYYLIGRDRMVEQVAAVATGRVIEIGCGTGRNLQQLAERLPHCDLYGIDASEQMLGVARLRMRRAGFDQRVRLTRCLAERLDFIDTFGLDRPFDAAVFSYVLSMIPDWRAALDRAVGNLPPAGTLHIVDFGDMADLPRPAAKALRKWLGLFGVTPRPDILDWCRTRARFEGGSVTCERLARGYAFVATYRRPDWAELPDEPFGWHIRVGATPRSGAPEPPTA
jgi:S-adenosylmethionine-diacylgycerolhomoserine-N-methlytransferase